MYYTFETQVSRIFSGIDSTFQVGDILTHVFMVDKSLDQYGNPFVSSGSGYHTYYAEFLSGPVYQITSQTPYPLGTNEIFAMDWTYSQSGPVTDTYVFLGFSNYVIELHSNHPYQDGFLMSQAINQYGEPYASYIDLNLLSFTVQNENPLATAPVPEPATILLYGLGIAGVAVAGRRRRKIQAN